MASTISDSFNLPPGISAESFTRACNAALRMHQWTDPFIDREAATIVAHMKHDATIMGKSWNYRLSATISWQRQGDEISSLKVIIREANYDWSAQECRRQLDQLATAIDECLGRAAIGATARGARWAGDLELERAGYLGQLEGNQLLITQLPDGRIMRLPARDTNRHALVCGPTGSGKTTGIFIPNLIERTDTCALVTEATGGKGLGDLFESTSGWRAAHGHRIFYFNADAPVTHRINPLEHVTTYRQARRVCEIIMQSTTLRTHRGDQSWELSERMLLTGLVLHATGQRERGRCHLGYVNEILNSGIQGLQRAMATTNVEEADICFTRFIKSTTDSYRNLVLNGVMNRLDAWNTPQVRLATETTDMNWSELVNELWTLYLAVPAAKAELKPLMALIFNDLIEFIMSHQFTYPPMLMLDEFTNFGYVAGLPAKLTIIRHDGVPAVMGVQDYIQLELLYDREAKLLISQPGTRIFFKPNDLETAQRISQMLGEAINESTRLGSNGQLHDKEKKEPLLSTDSLLNLTAAADGRNTMIVMTPGTRPVQVSAFHWSDYSPFTDRAAYPPPEIPALSAVNQLTPRRPDSHHDPQGPGSGEREKPRSRKHGHDRDTHEEW